MVEQVLSRLRVDEDVVGRKASQREKAPLKVDLDESEEEGEDHCCGAKQVWPPRQQLGPAAPYDQDAYRAEPRKHNQRRDEGGHHEGKPLEAERKDGEADSRRKQ